jgi:hypothetical protein
MKLDQQQQDLVDYNYLLSMGILTSNTISGEFYEGYNFSCYNRGVPDRRFNVFFIKEGTSNPDRLLQKGEQYFKSRNLPFRVAFKHGLESDFLTPLSERGYREGRPDIVMTLMELQDKNTFQKDLTIKKVSTAEELAHFQEVAEKSYSLPPGVGSFAINDRILRLPDVEMFIGYTGDEPASISMLFQTGPVAGIYWVGTLEKFRNRGFGKEITAAPLVAGKNRGCSFASLQASDLGKPVYEKMGFDNPYNYRSFLSP